MLGPALPFPADNSPGIRVSLSRPIYRISIDAASGAPEMPKDVIATADAVNWPPGTPRPAVFTWKVYLEWNSAACATQHEIEHQFFTFPSPFHVDLHSQVRGGTLTVVAKTQIGGREIYGQAHAQVLADNPTRGMVLRAFPPNRFGLIASKIGAVESGLQQFTPPHGPDPGGRPLISRTSDIGLMQLNAPSGSITSADQVWDWRANLRRGLEMLQGKRRITLLASRSGQGMVRMPAVIRDQDWATLAGLNLARRLFGLPHIDTSAMPPLSDKPGSGILPGEPDPDHVQLSQEEREAIRRYNGGHEYAYTLMPDVAGMAIVSAGWQVDPTRGGIRPGAGDPDYVLHVLSAHSGFVLPPPPALHPRHAVHRRRRKR